jgi:hypothetical protein
MAKSKAAGQATRPVFGEDYGLGWVGFVHADSLISGAIAYLTRRERQGEVVISHAFLVSGPNECIEANLPAGVVASDIDKEYLGRDDRLVIFRRPKCLSKAAAGRIVKRARAQVGAAFDYGGFAAEGLGDTFVGYLFNTLLGGVPKEKLAEFLHQKGRYVCSDLVAYCLRQEPRYKAKEILNQPAGALTPQALFEDDDLFDPPPGRQPRSVVGATRTRHTSHG